MAKAPVAPVVTEAKEAEETFKLGTVECVVKGTTVTITIDLTADHGESGSGKSRIVTSTRGNKEIGDTGVFLGVNAFRYATPKKAKR